MNTPEKSQLPQVDPEARAAWRRAVDEQFKIATTPLDEGEVREFQRQLTYMSPEDWLTVFGPIELSRSDE